MSVVYFMAFDKQLKKTEFFYSEMFENYKLNLFGDDGILFDKNLSEAEKTVVGTLFQQRVVYSVKTSIPFGYKEDDKKILSEDYYLAERNQIIWLKNFIRQQLERNGEIFLIRLSIGHKINYGQITSEYVDIDSFQIPEKEFEFEPMVIYQFVNNH